MIAVVVGITAAVLIAGYWQGWLPPEVAISKGPAANDSDDNARSRDLAANAGIDSESKISGPIADADISQSEQAEIEQFVTENEAYRYRIVDVDTDHLREQIREGPGDTVLLNLFHDVDIEIQSTISRENASGDFSGIAMLWGFVEGGGSSSHVNLIIGPSGAVRSEIVTVDGVYFITAIGDPGHHIVWQQDPEHVFVID